MRRVVGEFNNFILVVFYTDNSRNELSKWMEYKEQEEVSDELMVDVQDEQSEISLADNAMEVEEDGHSGCKCETCGQTFPTKRILSNHIVC